MATPGRKGNTCWTCESQWMTYYVTNNVEKLAPDIIHRLQIANEVNCSECDFHTVLWWLFFILFLAQWQFVWCWKRLFISQSFSHKTNKKTNSSHSFFVNVKNINYTEVFNNKKLLKETVQQIKHTGVVLLSIQHFLFFNEDKYHKDGRKVFICTFTPFNFFWCFVSKPPPMLYVVYVS